MYGHTNVKKMFKLLVTRLMKNSLLRNKR